MDASTEMDAILRAVRERQQSDLEASIDVAARLRSFQANVDNSWWAELEEYRESLIATAAWALSPSLWRAGDDRVSARNLVDKTYRDALENLSELHRRTPAKRRRWLLNRTLEQVAELIEERAAAPATRFTKLT
jgi:hypothetical protein